MQPELADWMHDTAAELRSFLCVLYLFEAHPFNFFQPSLKEYLYYSLSQVHTMRPWKIFLFANYASFLYGATNIFITDIAIHYTFPELDMKLLFDPFRMTVHAAVSALVFIAHAEYLQWWIALDEFRGDMFSWKLSVRVYFVLLTAYIYLNYCIAESIYFGFEKTPKNLMWHRFLYIGPNSVLLTALCEELGINHAIRRLLLTDL